MSEVVYLTTEALLRIASQLGVKDVRDLGLLDSTAQRPQSVVFGVESYPRLSAKVAALMHSIVCNHPLVDGNKRLGFVAAAVMCELNNAPLAITNDEAYAFTYAIAAGELTFEDMVQQFSVWLHE